MENRIQKENELIKQNKKTKEKEHEPVTKNTCSYFKESFCTMVKNILIF